MATYEHNALQQYKDQTGDMHIVYPVTKAENVDGLYETPALTGVPTAPTAASGTNTTQIATTEFVQTEISDLKKSVSDGKTAVANAITAKGVETAADATFATMANNIANISSSGGEISLNLFTQLEEPNVKDGVWVETSNQYEKAIVDNRILSSGGVWTKPVTDLPTNFMEGSAVVYNGEIHILGSNPTGELHYKWNGSSWTKVSTLPSNFYRGSAVVYNGEIHILGGYNYTQMHYKWTGSSWTKVSTIPYAFYCGSAVVYNGEIHILGDMNNTTKHYKWNGSSWTSVSTLPYAFNYGSAVVYNGEIHILGGGSNTTYCYHYKWNGSSWTRVSSIPYALMCGSAVVYNGEIHILGGNYGSANHYKWNSSSWTSVSSIPYNSYLGSAVVYNLTSIVNLGGNGFPALRSRATFISPANTYDPYTLIIQRGNTNNGTYVTAFADMSVITGSNNRFQTGFDDIWYFGESDFETTPIYYGNGSSWVKFKN